MLSPSYYLRVLSGMSLKKYNEVLDRAVKASGKSKAWLTKDILHCARKHGAGYYDYMTFGFWDLTDEQRSTYITRIRSKKLITFLNDQRYNKFFEDKELFNEVFKDFIKRDYINYQSVDKEKVQEFVAKHPTVFCKPVEGSCGKGCQRINSEDYGSFDEFYNDLGKEDAWLIEEVLKQHPDNAKIYPNAMNCLRLITVLDSKGEPHVIFATQKYGLNGRVVDNYGFGCRVDLETGKIMSPGVSGDGSLAIIYDEHPLTHEKLVGHQVPMFFEACELAKKAALVIPQVRYVGWDIGITTDGPAIVEGNDYCAHDFWQLPAQTPEKTGMLPVFLELVPELKDMNI